MKKQSAEARRYEDDGGGTFVLREIEGRVKLSLREKLKMMN